MLLLTQALWVSSFLLELALLWRARTAHLLARYPFLFSYIAYTFLGSYTTFLVFWLRPSVYPTAFWLFYFTRLLAEFAVIAAISDRIFEHYPVIRRLGRFAVAAITVAFAVLLGLPALIHPLSSDLAILKFSVWASLAKAVTVAVVIVIAHYYRLPFGRNTAGVMTGFVLYLSVYGTSFAVGQAFGKELSAWVFRFVGPTGWVVCLIVWMVTLWRPEPAKEKDRALHTQPDWVLSHEIDRLNGALSKRLGR